MIIQDTIQITAPRRGLFDITPQVLSLVAQHAFEKGLCHIFLHHTSASLIISENADTQVSEDLEAFMQRLIPDGDPLLKHIAEGPDDMPAHIRMVLTQTSLSIPIQNSKLALGTWQGIFLWEHRIRPSLRKMTVTLLG